MYEKQQYPETYTLIMIIIQSKCYDKCNHKRAPTFIIAIIVGTIFSGIILIFYKFNFQIVGKQLLEIEFICDNFYQKNQKFTAIYDMWSC